MSKFHTIGISSLVALHPKVETRNLLGLFERVCYQPTRSLIASYRNFYNRPEADMLQQIAEAEDPTACLATAAEVQTVGNGDYRLDLCLSADCQFAAFQVFQLRRGVFEPYSRLCFLEGEAARSFENLLA